MKINPGFDIQPTCSPLGFTYGPDSFGPEVEHRLLESIRKSLEDPNCEGPYIVYSIAMDVGKKEHKNLLEDMMLLFGAVTFAKGKLGKEPIRSQGHIHKVSRHSGWSPPEVYEIWSGQAVIYMQETAKDNPGRCFAVYAEPGDIVIVPPGWAHATISADSKQPLTFGAWCDREYGFEYDEIRRHNGLAWYPVFNDDNSLKWIANSRYQSDNIIVKKPNTYDFSGIKQGVPIYTRFEYNPQKFQFVSKPFLQADKWIDFIP